jgi:hypothetical protein
MSAFAPQLCLAHGLPRRRQAILREWRDIRNFIAYGVFAMPAESSRKIAPNSPYRRET